MINKFVLLLVGALSSLFAVGEIKTDHIHSNNQLSQKQGSKFVTGAYDGMSFTTSDSVGRVDVRAMSFGPGVCTTHITIGGKTVAIPAPPGVYSNWVQVISHIGSVKYAVSKSDKCDTGTQFQIRYWK